MTIQKKKIQWALRNEEKEYHFKVTPILKLIIHQVNESYRFDLRVASSRCCNRE